MCADTLAFIKSSEFSAKIRIFQVFKKKKKTPKQIFWGSCFGAMFLQYGTIFYFSTKVASCKILLEALPTIILNSPASAFQS